MRIRGKFLLFLSVIFAIALIFTAPKVVKAVTASVDYWSPTFVGGVLKEWNHTAVDDAEILDSSDTYDEDAGTFNKRFYVASGSGITFDNPIIEAGKDISIILASGCSISGSIKVPSGASLTFYEQYYEGQPYGSGTGTFGDENNEENKGVILHKDNGDTTITINGGNFYLKTLNGTIITINGGNIIATTTDNNAAIGGEYSSTATLATNSIIINGGTINATGNDGAGIGGADGQEGKNITINGGNITARSNGNGAGIGGGKSATGSSITINAGHVTAESHSGAGIGGGSGGNACNITINGGEISATGGGNSAAIGNSAISNAGTNTNLNAESLIAKDITITGGNVTATAGNGGTCIGAGMNHILQNFVMTGGELTLKRSSLSETDPNYPGIATGTGIGYSLITADPAFTEKIPSTITITGGTIISEDGIGVDMPWLYLPDYSEEGIAHEITITIDISSLGVTYPKNLIPRTINYNDDSSIIIAQKPLPKKDEKKEEKYSENSVSTEIASNIEKKLGKKLKSKKIKSTYSTPDTAVAAELDGDIYKDEDGIPVAKSFITTDDGKLRYTNKNGKYVKNAFVASINKETNEISLYYIGKNSYVVMNKKFKFAGVSYKALENGALADQMYKLNKKGKVKDLK